MPACLPGLFVTQDNHIGVILWPNVKNKLIQVKSDPTPPPRWQTFGGETSFALPSLGVGMLRCRHAPASRTHTHTQNSCSCALGVMLIERFAADWRSGIDSKVIYTPSLCVCTLLAVLLHIYTPGIKVNPTHRPSV